MEYKLIYIAAIIINSQTGIQMSFKHVYFVRLIPAGSDQSDSYSNSTIANPCFPNPCQNQGLCSLSINNTYTCLCTALWSGKNYTEYTIIFKIKKLIARQKL
jgi:hypothetical protein